MINLYTGYYYDNFESGTLNKWNIIRGDWEIITEPSGNRIAHLNRSSICNRIMISKDIMSDNIILQAKVKGNATGDVADTTIGFYSNDNGSSYWYVMLGGWNGGKYLTLGKRVNNVEYNLVRLFQNYLLKSYRNVYHME